MTEKDFWWWIGFICTCYMFLYICVTARYFLTRKRVWHGPEEMPDREEEILIVLKGDGFVRYILARPCTLKYLQMSDIVIVEKWAYVKDLEALE